ncbi:unnamed protein product [Paramecium sonneborni]|uniref:Uncharacterized protein n=1 Tax=Paramecium sonneborni TaxID=65129 RepID=A0A8S1R3N2_9CILI|nr:unnamed protein product [Paramecium sonneborni]
MSQSLSFDNKPKRKDLLEDKISFQKGRLQRPQHFTPQRQRILQNTKQIMDTYLNSQINNIQIMRSRSIQTPQKERIRTVSQQISSSKQTPNLSKQSLLLENQNSNFLKWSITKKPPQFKIK